MDNYILIAVGGSGARVAQSVVAMAAAGMPGELGINTAGTNSQLIVKLVDIDVNHNDGIELYEMIMAYNKAVGQFINENPTLFQKDGWHPLQIKLLTHEEFIFDARLGGAGIKRESIEDLVTGLTGDPRFLLDSLLGQDDREMNLLAGCKAKPRIGSLLWQYLYATDSNGFWDDIRSLTVPGNNTRIMFVGSVFGGTGASGVPTLAKLLRKTVNAGVHGNEAYGISLLTPYFQLAPPTDAPVQSNKFPFESKMAMGYYESDPELLQMDCIQIVGDQLRCMMKKNEQTGTWEPIGYTLDSTGEQNNPSLPAELVAAVGIHQFFAATSSDKLTIHGYDTPINEALSEVYSADMLPQAQTSGKCLYRLTRFCHTLLNYYDYMSQKKPLAMPTVFHNLWEKSEIRDKNWRNDKWLNGEQGMGGILDFAKTIERWLTDLEHNGMRDLLDIDRNSAIVSNAAKKGRADFSVHEKTGKDIMGIVNDSTNAFFRDIIGMDAREIQKIRQRVFMLALLRACTTD